MFFKKISLAIGFTSTLMASSVITPVFAQSYQCVLPAGPERQVKRVPHGNWNPLHNTNRWYYSAVNGRDIFRHKNGKRTVGTRCKGAGYNYGVRMTDYQGGLQDYCVKTTPSHPQRIGTPSCPSGYSLSSNHGTCTRPAKSGYWNKSRKPRGNWGPQHNTKNWSYAVVNGKDIYRHKKGKRTVGTRCKGAGYNFGTHKVDLNGNQDWCASWVAAIPASSIKASCSALGGGFVLRPKSATGGSLGPGSSVKPGIVFKGVQKLQGMKREAVR